MSARRCRLGAAVGVSLAATLLMTACASVPNAPTPLDASEPAPPIVVTPGPGSDNVDPLGKIQVSATEGILTSVQVTNEEGKAVEGILTPDKTAWKPSAPLGYGHTYTVAAQGLTLTGATGPTTASFTTLTPGNQTKAYLTTTFGKPLSDGATYGVGTVIVAHFDEPIPDKAAAEKKMQVTSDPPVAGSWYWIDDRNAHWRPQEYWPAGAKVNVSADLYGAQVGPDLYGQEDTKTSFVIGPSHVSVADDNTHQVQVFENGQLIRTMPTSMGMGGKEDFDNKTIYFNTPSGIYTVMDKGNPVIMDSETYGLPVNSRLGYKEAISWATRISADGIYLHQLDTTVWAQGNTDTSHGCLNLNADNARWFYNWAMPGDVVEVRNTSGPPLSKWNNGDWSVPWDEWVEGSALH